MKKLLFLFALLLIVVLSGCTTNSFETVFVTQEQLVGKWTIDAAYTKDFTGKDLQEMYGSAFGTYGCGMEFGNDGAFNYYIAMRTGGEGSYTVSKVNKCISVELADSKFSIWAVSIDGNLRLMMDQGGDLIIWKKI